jgi:hypothetical protein
MPVAEIVVRPITSPLLVGRDQHLDALTAVIATVQQAGSREILISGEAGIGKTRLVAETGAWFRALIGGARFTGQCIETDRSLPYRPFRDLILDARDLSPSDTQSQLVEDPEVASLSPGLAVRLQHQCWGRPPVRGACALSRRSNCRTADDGSAGGHALV